MLTDLLKLQMDFFGARGEYAMTVLGGRLLREAAPTTPVPKPVITLPGFMASEATLERLNRFLNLQGYRAESWGLGRSSGSEGEDWRKTVRIIKRRLRDKVKALSDETSQGVSLVGHSMGGIYARELAVRMEKDVDRVIMLGSPSFHPYRVDQHNRVLEAVTYWANRKLSAEFHGRRGLLHWDPDDPPMPCVAIHSPIDGFADEGTCHIPDYIVAQSGSHAPRENIRVLSSHLGMSANPWVLLAVADRLNADRAEWRPFEPRDYFPGTLAPLRRLIYPPLKRDRKRPGRRKLLESVQ
jgi:pimeloyl-ACP methyl ester carboxylesterase